MVKYTVIIFSYGVIGNNGRRELEWEEKFTSATSMRGARQKATRFCHDNCFAVEKERKDFREYWVVKDEEI